MGEKIKALGLFSGGLDSILAFKVLQEQGVECIAVHFSTPFYFKQGIKEIARRYDIPLIIRSVMDNYIDVLKDPVYGYGKNFNPCIDCHGFMFRTALGMLSEFGARFVFSGEVLGERPFSQTGFGLERVAQLSGAPELILRPLSARLLSPTLPEKQGWVDRERLLDIKGRSRRRQLELAAYYGIEVNSSLQPAGGCLLTDPRISKRIREYVKRFENHRYVIFELIKTGRHFIIERNTALIIGRNRFENDVIEGYGLRGSIFRSISVPGPVGLLFGEKATDTYVRGLAARILASYAKPSEKEVEVVFEDGDVFLIGQESRDKFKRYLI